MAIVGKIKFMKLFSAKVWQLLKTNLLLSLLAFNFFFMSLCIFGAFAKNWLYVV